MPHISYLILHLEQARGVPRDYSARLHLGRHVGHRTVLLVQERGYGVGARGSRCMAGAFCCFRAGVVHGAWRSPLLLLHVCVTLDVVCISRAGVVLVLVLSLVLCLHAQVCGQRVSLLLGCLSCHHWRPWY